MRKAGGILRDIFSLVASRVVPGCLLSDLDFQIGQLIASRGAISGLKLSGFPSYASICIDYEVVQAQPKGRIIKEGDLVSVDLSIFYKGYFVDKARTWAVDPSHYTKRYLASSVQKCLDNVIAGVKSGITTGELGLLMEQNAKYFGLQVGKEFSGHGIGEQPHQNPIIPNYNDGSDTVIENESYITIEPVVFYGGGYTLSRDNWEVSANILSAHAEDTLFVTNNHAEVIT
jgi:methionyl aminopeptidase